MSLSALVSAVMLAVFGTMVWLAFDFPQGARFMPLIVGVPGMALCALQLVNDLRAGRKVSADGAELGRHTLAAEVRAALWFGGFVGLVLLAGFLVAAPVLVFGYLWLEARVRAWRAALAAAVFVVWIAVMFEVVLGFALHTGVYGRAILMAVGWR